MRERAIGMIAWSSSIWAERLVLVGLLFSIFAMGLGTAWDIHWHSAVGRDSFWIPPHILVYSGAATAGVLAAATLSGAIAVGDVHRTLAGLRSHLSLGYGPVGMGAVIMVIAAVSDDIWHRTVRDSTIWSPPHTLGVVGAITTTLGTTLALLSAGRRGVLSDAAARTLAMLLMASILSAMHFALLAPALMVATPDAMRLSYFFVNTPYLAAGLASLTLPALLTCVRRLLGRLDFEMVAVAAVGMWSAQELFHLVATPLVAGLSGYAVKSNAYPPLLFALLVLGSMLIPALMVNRLRGGRPWMMGALLAGLYAAEVMGWTSILWAGTPTAWHPIAAVIAVGALSAVFGDRIGQCMSAGSLRVD